MPNGSSLMWGYLIDLLEERTFTVVSKVGREVTILTIGISTNENFFGVSVFAHAFGGWNDDCKIQHSRAQRSSPSRPSLVQKHILWAIGEPPYLG